MSYTEIEITEDEYEDLLNDIYGEVSICGQMRPSGTVLKEIDPTAFRCGLSDEESTWQCDECDTHHNDEDDALNCCPEDDEDDEDEEDGTN